MNHFKKYFSYGPLLIAMAALLWALDGLIRRSLYSIPPLHIVFFEHLIGSILLIPFFIKDFHFFRTFTKKELHLLLVVALLSSVFGTLWFTTALLKVNYIPFSVVFLLQKLQPIFVLITAAVVLKEKITTKHLQFGALAIIAAYFVTFPNGVVNLQTGAGTLIAAGYALLAAIAWGSSTVFSRILLLKKPDQVITTGRFFLATLFSFCIIYVLKQEPALLLVTSSQLLRFLFIALSTGMVAMVIYYKGLSKTPASIPTVIELLFPVTAIIIDGIVFKTLLLPSQYLAIVVLLFAIYKMSSLSKQVVTFTTKKVKGKGRGKQMGFPTINMKIPAHLSLTDGIYAARITLGNKSYKGALHYGPIPTFNEKGKSLEVFLLDTKKISDTLVERSAIAVEIVSYVRPIYAFKDVNALVRQIDQDVKNIRLLLS